MQNKYTLTVDEKGRHRRRPSRIFFSLFKFDFHVGIVGLFFGLAFLSTFRNNYYVRVDDIICTIDSMGLTHNQTVKFSKSEIFWWKKKIGNFLNSYFLFTYICWVWHFSSFLSLIPRRWVWNWNAHQLRNSWGAVGSIEADS